jgi:hypothetical protein
MSARRGVSPFRLSCLAQAKLFAALGFAAALTARSPPGAKNGSSAACSSTLEPPEGTAASHSPAGPASEPAGHSSGAFACKIIASGHVVKPTGTNGALKLSCGAAAALLPAPSAARASTAARAADLRIRIAPAPGATWL